MKKAETNWIETPEWTGEDRKKTRVVFFRKTLILDAQPAQLEVRITACSRYKLYVNGARIETGPAKGDGTRWFADTMDLSRYLQKGQNCIAVSVLSFPDDLSVGNHSVFRFGRPRLFAEGLGTEDWKYCVDRGTEFVREELRHSPLQIHEIAAPEAETIGWTLQDYDDSAWDEAVVSPRSTLPAALLPENLVPRDIPYMQCILHSFELPQRLIPANSECTFTLDAGEEMCAFLRLGMSGGKGAQIELLQSECYILPEGKGNRLDSAHGHLEGYIDRYTVAGAAEEVYEPYFFRTFRFLRVTVRTADAPLTLRYLDYDETGYPLELRTTVQTSDNSLQEIWEISARTLRRCMHETYMDCPFYEQLAYVMDTRAQILYTYAVSADDRLARRAIDDFRRAQRPDGLLRCSYPNINEIVIPGFSLYYILMVHDHMMYFGDRELVCRCLPVIDGILNFFDDHLGDDGLVKKVGGVFLEAPFWSFIDWAEDWMPTKGMPSAGRFGPITMESLLYLLGLQRASELCAWLGDTKTQEYQRRADVLTAAIRARCVDADGLLTDGPGRTEKSQHCQVFGVLTGVLDAETGKQNLLRSMTEPGFARCTVAMAYYLFRALEKTELYTWTDQCWEPWREMVRNGCSTCVEWEKEPRSECHAWGALVLWELPSAVLGVRPAAPGYEKIKVQPISGYLKNASGVVHTPHGDISVAWKLADGKLETQIDCTPELRKLIIP